MTNVYQNEALKPDEKSKELLKAMGDDPAKRLSQIEVLRSWIISHKFMECRTDDKFLLRFLRVCKFSCEAAKERIQKFCLMRTSKLDGLPEWFDNQNTQDPTLRAIISVGFCYMMPKPDDLGRIVFVYDMSKTDELKALKAHPEMIMKASWLVLDWMTHAFERCQIHGVNLIQVGSSQVDMELLKYAMDMERSKKSIELWQGATPVRMKAVHYYNMPQILKTFIDTTLKLLKPKMAKRIKFHSDYKPAENTPSHCMPSSLQGTGPSWEDLKDDFLRELDNFQAEFDSLKMCKVDDAKMPKKYVEGDDWGIGGSYVPISTD